jgi:hypothetical protein
MNKVHSQVNNGFSDDPPIIGDIIAVMEKMSRTNLHETFNLEACIAKVTR